MFYIFTSLYKIFLFQNEVSGVREFPELAVELSRSCVSLSTHSSSSNLSRSGSHSSLVNNSLAGMLLTSYTFAWERKKKFGNDTSNLIRNNKNDCNKFLFYYKRKNIIWSVWNIFVPKHTCKAILHKLSPKTFLSKLRSKPVKSEIMLTVHFFYRGQCKHRESTSGKDGDAQCLERTSWCPSRKAEGKDRRIETPLFKGRGIDRGVASWISNNSWPTTTNCTQESWHIIYT